MDCLFGLTKRTIPFFRLLWQRSNALQAERMATRCNVNWWLINFFLRFWLLGFNFKNVKFVDRVRFFVKGKIFPWQIAHSSASIEVGVMLLGNFFNLNIFIFSLFDANFAHIVFNFFKLMINGSFTDPSGIDEGFYRNKTLCIWNCYKLSIKVRTFFRSSYYES